MRDYILAIDQGTTSTRAIAFDLEGIPITSHQIELTQHYPGPGMVEHDGEEIFQATLTVCRKVLEDCDGRGAHPRAIGITNQRETTLVWDRKTGAPLAPAIVWQDRRTSDYCRALKEKGQEALVRQQTGLLLDPYFSGTKLNWLLDNVEGLRARAEAGEVCFGTVDSYLLFRLTGGAHLTDATNASRTLMCDVRSATWSDDLLGMLDIPRAMLPEIADCAVAFGETLPALFGRAIPVTGMIGDQQAASVGQGCVHSGDIKSTYGTGCFMLQNTGEELVISDNRLLGTIAYQIAGEITYALEGSIFVAGAGVQWLRDGLGVIGAAPDSEKHAARLQDNGGVYMVPAFTGLGAPHWNPEARAMIVGLERSSSIDHIIRATLESVAYQTHDLMVAMAEDGTPPPRLLRVDGGMVANDWFAGFLADVLNLEVDRPRVVETTALGAAFMAGVGAGIYKGLDDVRDLWQLDRSFTPDMGQNVRMELLTGWKDALARCLMPST